MGEPLGFVADLRRIQETRLDAEEGDVRGLQ